LSQYCTIKKNLNENCADNILPDTTASLLTVIVKNSKHGAITKQLNIENKCRQHSGNIGYYTWVNLNSSFSREHANYDSAAKLLLN